MKFTEWRTQLADQQRELLRTREVLRRELLPLERIHSVRRAAQAYADSPQFLVDVPEADRKFRVT